jgi:hypothetical protein
MIRRLFENTVLPLASEKGITCYVESTSIQLNEDDFERDFCYCQKVVCTNDFMYAFASENDFEKDFFSLFSQIKIVHTVVFKIKNLRTSIETVLVNGVHGVLLNHDTNTKQFIVDWTKVKQQLGGGTYDLIIERDYLGSISKQFYRSFLVTDFDNDLADGTIRITTYKNGSMESGYYYNDFNIFSQIRLKGSVLNEKIVSEIDSNPNQKRLTKQVQDREWSEYDVYIYSIEEKILKYVQDLFFSDVILVNDYNIMNKTYKDLKLRKKSIEMENVSKFFTTLIFKSEDYEKKLIKNG